MKIALDLDDVLVSTNELIIETFQEHGLDKATALGFMANWGLVGAPEEIVKAVKAKFENAKLCCNPNKVLDGARDWVLRHKDKHDLIVVTSRPDCIAKQTKLFVERVFGIHRDKVFVVKDKEEVLVREGVEVLIDDAPHNIAPIKKHGIMSIMISNENTPYNWASLIADLKVPSLDGFVTTKVLSKMKELKEVRSQNA